MQILSEIGRGDAHREKKQKCDPYRPAVWWWQKNFTGKSFWARGDRVYTVGLDEAMVLTYIRRREQEDERYDQMKLGL